MLTPASLNHKPLRPRCADTDWETLTPIIKAFKVQLPATRPTTPNLDEWLSDSRNRLVALLRKHTPVSRQSHYSKHWWSPNLTILRREYHKAAKNQHFSSFLLTSTLQNLWTAKRFAYGRAQPCFPSLPGAETPQQMNSVLLDHFFPPKEPFSLPPRLRPHGTAPILTKEEIWSSLCKCSPTSAPGPEGIPYSTGKHVNKINPSFLLKTLGPLVQLGYNPASLKGSNGVILAKPGKPSFESPSSFRIIVLIHTL